MPAVVEELAPPLPPNLIAYCLSGLVGTPDVPLGLACGSPSTPLVVAIAFKFAGFVPTNSDSKLSSAFIFKKNLPSNSALPDLSTSSTPTNIPLTVAVVGLFS